jgi:CheY-like chemotaxis protein
MRDDTGALLVVDDEQFLRDAVATLLSSLGFTVASAGTGTAALRLARTHPFDLLILDVMLPDLDGFEIVQRLRGDRNHVPVIFLTAKDTREDKVAGLTIGGDDYITKPFHRRRAGRSGGQAAAHLRAFLPGKDRGVPSRIGARAGHDGRGRRRPWRGGRGYPGIPHGLRITLTLPVEQPASAPPPVKTELADTATA